jgi:hypothetical protein
MHNKVKLIWKDEKKKKKKTKLGKTLSNWVMISLSLEYSMYISTTYKHDYIKIVQANNGLGCW